MEISKSDWKLFRARIAEWQEAYMERLVAYSAKTEHSLRMSGALFR